MNAVPELQPQPSSTALTVTEQARTALKSEQTEKDFRALVEQSQSIKEITNGDGYKQCHSARMALVRARTTLSTLDKEVRENLVATNKAIIAECKRLTEIVQPEERRLQQIQEAWDAKVAAEKRARAEAEAQRVAAIKERIDNDIRGAVLGAVGRPSADIERIIADIEAIAIDHTFAEFQKEAEGAKATTLIRLRVAHTKAVEAETEARRLEQERAAQAAERERLARERAEQEAAAAKERARIAEEQRVAREAAAAEAARQAEELRQQREAQEAAAARERARLEEEARQARLKREAEEQEHQARLKRQREEEERQAAERRRLLDEEERSAAQRREAEEARLAAERAEVERQQEALRLQQEALAKPSDPVEATEQEDVKLVVVEGVMRPTDEEIIEVVAEAFEVSAEVAAGWIVEMAICRDEK